MHEPSVDRVEAEIAAALGMNAGYVVDVYAQWRESPQSVPAGWRDYFEGVTRGEISPLDLPGRSPGGNGAPARTADALVLGPGETLAPLRGGAARIAENMQASLDVPIATSYRNVSVKVLEENRRFLNQHLALGGDRGKISFTHIIAWAVARSMLRHPGMNDAYAAVKGEPHRVRRPHVNVGLAVDLPRKDGTRTLLVPVVRDTELMDFRAFRDAYDRLVARARAGQLEPADFTGATFTLTNPGTVGTAMSVPRLMRGQGAIIAVGAIGYSAATRAMSEDLISRLGIGKQMTISCTYDHRIIQGAESGAFLADVEALLMGEEEFYDRLYQDLGVPYHPARWTADVAPTGLGAGTEHDVTRQARVLQLIHAYRVRGHLIAHLDPLGKEPQYHPDLDLEEYGLTMWDLDRTFATGEDPERGSAWERPRATLREILETLRAAYCGTIGIEYMGIQDPEQKRWIQARVEPPSARAPLTDALRRRILAKLIDAETFERFLHTKFMGHKRFSLEGGEGLVVILDQLLERAAEAGVLEIVLGLSHRGRLTVLTQVAGVSPEGIFSEFQGTRDPDVTQGSGDVKYHLGAKGVHRAENGAEIKIAIAPNPSHLEGVDPVVEGIARAKQEVMGVVEGRQRVLPVLLHGDAAFAGQGVVAETLNLSQLKGYRTGGTIHVIVNNQIGFTTPVESARSSPYATDVAKMGQVPVLHVNGDDPEALVRVLAWAHDFRMTFHKDVVIDMFCFRRHGHNEGDEPSYTQPRMYAKIREHPGVAVRYAERLVRDDVLGGEDVEAMRRGAWERLEASLARSASGEASPLRPEPIVLTGRSGGRPVPRGTAVDAATLSRIGAALVAPAPGVDIHPKLVRWIERRKEAMASGEGIDWALAEALAFGSLVLEQVPVRLSGQDTVRGTFSQRHLLYHDDDTDTSWMPLAHLAPDQAPFTAIDSPLSEEAVLGFEFGYTLGDPSSLVLWEAQFGDFVNAAQVVIDQFISGARVKWGQPTSLTLLLPHGYEGQGPEHSNARPERFLQLAAEDNWRIANVTTPAQYFHILRRQACEGPQIPLVLFTPKSLLRHPRAVSRLSDLSQGRFEPVLSDPLRPDPRGVRRLVLCSGKVIYDLVEAREKRGTRDVALVRLEQFYPFPETALRETLAAHAGAEVVWVQEEPRNMGGWTWVSDRLRRLSGQAVEPRYVGRAESASPATGYLEVHLRDQERLVAQALDLD